MDADGSGCRTGRAWVLRSLSSVIEEASAGEGSRTTRSPVMAEVIAGGALELLRTRLRLPRWRPIDLTNALMWMVVLPYLGPVAADRELNHATPEAARPCPIPKRAVLKDLNMRVTYRTASVLAAVAAQPGSSNIAIGTTAGISDQGQISKLMARLARLELVSNTGPGCTLGAANSWCLTPWGQEVHTAIRHKAMIGPPATSRTLRGSGTRRHA
jgi:hypothetical protein